ncbi:MAG: modified peptide precursor CbpA [Rhodocyclaceae bacterium]|nr:modified peptide precursor CbpA [Rhodocyclaceae bacterium]
MSTITPQQDQTPTQSAAPQTVATPVPPPAVIASRQRCDADGVGLSHYILMDRKPSA